MNSHIPEEYGGPGLDYLSGCLIEEELGWGCSGIGTSLMCNGLATAPVVHRRLRGGQEGVPRHAHRGAQAGLLLPHRAGRRLGRLRHAHHRRQEGRQVRHQRHQVLHHERLARELVHGLREDRQGGRPPRHLRLRGPARRRRGGRQEGGQARPARLRHRDDLLQRRRDPRGQPARRGEQGLQARDDDARPHAPGRVGDGGGHRAGGLRVRPRLRQGARPVRRADRHAPGDPVHDRRHGDQGRGGPPARPGSRPRCSTRASATRSPPRTPSASPRTPRWR